MSDVVHVSSHVDKKVVAVRLNVPVNALFIRSYPAARARQVARLGLHALHVRGREKHQQIHILMFPVACRERDYLELNILHI